MSGVSSEHVPHPITLHSEHVPSSIKCDPEGQMHLPFESGVICISKHFSHVYGSSTAQDSQPVTKQKEQTLF